MKARIHFKTPDVSGSFENTVSGATFTQWMEEVSQATVGSRGFAYLIGERLSIQLRYITRIEKLED